ncbi:D-alanyl-D-alanine carboxypeptidase [Methanocalculus alkaliphilus]|uniref:serine hydrolase domain-containing protein n=1 Tax=Methanocalculus alkaliphilus TaxID=768730 RepID=UPI00209FAC4F|nr:serine hydrolase domain-containing protein [Methanocalculus alkaliphilus]MCP1715193.1 D-alanyl-D-alanine carboxypeptidase [Methanocalculus alkaliphilus]
MHSSEPVPEDTDKLLTAPPPSVDTSLQRIVSDGVSNAEIPGTVIEIVTPDWRWSHAAGYASISPVIPAETGMHFFIASVTKPFVSVAILQLAEEGKLALDDPIDSYLPVDIVKAIPKSDEITIRQLLDHTSGIADYDEISLILEAYENPGYIVSYEQGMWDSLHAGPLYDPEMGYTYSNVNYILLTLIIDRVSGTTYEEYIKEHILDPLGMKNTSVHRTNRLPQPYMHAIEDLEGDGGLMDFSNLYKQYDRGSGDIVSTTADLNVFHKALVSGMLISPSSRGGMMTISPQSEKSVDMGPLGSGSQGYGLGYIITSLDEPANLTLSGHTGGYPGASTFWYYLAEEDTYLTLHANSAMRAAAVHEEILLPLLLFLTDNGPAGS